MTWQCLYSRELWTSSPTSHSKRESSWWLPDIPSIYRWSSELLWRRASTPTANHGEMARSPIQCVGSELLSDCRIWSFSFTHTKSWMRRTPPSMKQPKCLYQQLPFVIRTLIRVWSVIRCLPMTTQLCLFSCMQVWSKKPFLEARGSEKSSKSRVSSSITITVQNKLLLLLVVLLLGYRLKGWKRHWNFSTETENKYNSETRKFFQWNLTKPQSFFYFFSGCFKITEINTKIFSAKLS